MRREHDQGIKEAQEQHRRFTEEQRRQSEETIEKLKRSIPVKTPQNP